MENRVRTWSLWGFLVTCALGTLLHFAFDLTGENLLVGAVAAVNESVWEHMKILFWPMFLFALAESRVLGICCRSYWPARAAGILTGVLLIPVIYYTYTGALGIREVLVDIISFYVAAAAGWWLGGKLLERDRRRGTALQWVGFGLLCLLALVFAWWSFSPPELPVFQDPQTMKYGIFP